MPWSDRQVRNRPKVANLGCLEDHGDSVAAGGIDGKPPTSAGGIGCVAISAMERIYSQRASVPTTREFAEGGWQFPTISASLL